MGVRRHADRQIGRQMLRELKHTRKQEDKSWQIEGGYKDDILCFYDPPAARYGPMGRMVGQGGPCVWYAKLQLRSQHRGGGEDNTTQYTYSYCTFQCISVAVT